MYKHIRELGRWTEYEVCKKKYDHSAGPSLKKLIDKIII